VWSAQKWRCCPLVAAAVFIAADSFSHRKSHERLSNSVIERYFSAVGSLPFSWLAAGPPFGEPQHGGPFLAALRAPPPVAAAASRRAEPVRFTFLTGGRHVVFSSALGWPEDFSCDAVTGSLSPPAALFLFLNLLLLLLLLVLLLLVM